MPHDAYDYTLGVLRDAVDRARLGNAPDQHLAAGREAVDAELAPALGLRGGLLLLESRTAADPAREQALGEQARSVLERALALDPGLPLELGAILAREKRPLLVP